jgi:hypothetical protein
MKNVLKVLGIGSLFTGGLVFGFNIGMISAYLEDADSSESKIPPFPV